MFRDLINFSITLLECHTDVNNYERYGNKWKVIISISLIYGYSS